MIQASREVRTPAASRQPFGVERKESRTYGASRCQMCEMLAVIGAPGSGWTSQRDHLLLGLLYNTGARVSEIIGVRVSDVVLDKSSFVHLHGKGRKQRSVPLWRTTVKEVRAWLKRNPYLGPASALLPNRDGERGKPL